MVYRSALRDNNLEHEPKFFHRFLYHMGVANVGVLHSPLQWTLVDRDKRIEYALRKQTRTCGTVGRVGGPDLL